MANRLNLLLHCGGRKVDRELVDEVETPAATDTHFPIPHKQLIDDVQSRLPEFGLQVVNEQHALMKDDFRYFGLMQVEPTMDGDTSLLSPDHAFVLGLRNSHDKSFPAGLCVGNGVFVCDNLCFSAEIVIGRKHTRHILRDLPTLIHAALGKMATARIDQEKRIEAYKNTDISDMQADHLIINACRAKALKPTQIIKVAQEWREPEHPEFKERNAWSLLNAMTQHQKGINPFELSSRTQRMHPLLDAACGITIGGESAVIDSNVVDADFVVNRQNVLA